MSPNGLGLQRVFFFGGLVVFDLLDLYNPPDRVITPVSVIILLTVSLFDLHDISPLSGFLFRGSGARSRRRKYT